MTPSRNEAAARWPGLRTEQGMLRLSVAVTVLVAAFGVVLGLLSGSFAIVFDGVYSLLDASMTSVMLLVSNLIAASTAGDARYRTLVQKFTMGFWHLEPIVLGVNGMLLVGAAVYAFINAIGIFMTGGRELAFDLAILYAAVALLVCAGMALLGFRANRELRSDLVALDARSWLMSAAITAALLAAFGAGQAIQGTELAWISPYIDPAVLALVCLVIIPLPIGTIRQALADILLVTPAALKQHVDEVAQTMVQRYGFLSYRAYVARVGRGRQIELYFIVPAGWPAKRLEEWDRLRDEIGEAIGEDSPDLWLTIVFTTDSEWAE